MIYFAKYTIILSEFDASHIFELFYSQKKYSGIRLTSLAFYDQAGVSRRDTHGGKSEVEPYRGFARCILAVFQKYAIFAQFQRTPLSPTLLKTCETTIWFHFIPVGLLDLRGLEREVLLVLRD